MRDRRGNGRHSRQQRERLSEKMPGRWHSSLASIKREQGPFWRRLALMCLFTLKQLCVFEGTHAAKDVSIRKSWREHRGNKHVPHIEMNLSWARTQLPPSPTPLSHLSFLSLYAPLSLSPLSHIEAPLCSFAPSPLRMRCRGPRRGPFPLGSRAKQRRWCYQNAARRLSACIGPGWASGRLADACPCQAPSAFPPWTSAVCGNAVQFVCGCILILHLFGCSRAWPGKPAALLALLVLIALAWLAVCFWLHSLISIPQEATTTVAPFTHTHNLTPT